jgi:hypothetical protein
MDVQPLYVAADRMDEVAAVLRARARHIAAGAASTQWRSTAARAYFDRIDAATAQLVSAATRVNALADRVRSHALRIALAGP